MPRTSNATTVNTSNKVWVRVLETLSSTNETAAGRSVIDSKRLTLIIARQLLSAPDRPRSPSPAQCPACTRDRKPRRECRIASTENQSGRPALSRHLKPKCAPRLNFRLRQSRDRSPSSFELQAPECRKRFRESERFRDLRSHLAAACRASLAQLAQTSSPILF